MNYIIENQYIAKEFRITNNKLISAQLQNKISGDAFTPDGSGAEFYIHFINSDDSISPKNTDVTEVIEEEGKLTVHFEEKMGFQCTLQFTLGAEDRHIRKQLSFQCTGNEAVDYIDLESIGLANAKTSWSRPDMAKTVGGVDGYYSTLGQPVYFDSFYIGCEFPATENKIDGGAHIRYYRGESYHGQHVSTPVTIIGAARSSDKEILRQDFLAYIEGISVPADLRVQYNSWYDHMLKISAENIEESFYEIEKGITGQGIPPMDSYVVDDGWNDYSKPFWCFNKKFPNELYDSMDLAKRFCSNFGLWLGPRGGYTTNTPKFAKHMDRAGTGHYNPKANDICVGSKLYQDNVQKIFLDYMERFDINYWKLDGFINKPCPKTNHGHKTGGYKQMYYITECWERWIAIFASMRKAREEKGKDLWINMTCYVNPSPWWLQWVNSFWLQNCQDMDFAHNVKGQRQVDQVLSYRDDRYFDFAQVRDQQFPLSRIYNHEPIYGNTAKLKYTDEEFEKYLYMHATRGMAFWELYYSYNLMSPAKWKANGDVLKWVRANYHILKHAQLIGETPVKNRVYGYSAWTDEEGILSLRNPTSKPASFKITLDELIGVKDSVQNVHRYNVYNKTEEETQERFSRGASFTVTLAPFEVKVYQFGAEDKRYAYPQNCNDFSILFTPAADGKVASNNDVTVAVEKGHTVFTVDDLTLTTRDSVLGKELCLVREKNGMLKAYVNGTLTDSVYHTPAKTQVNQTLQLEAAGGKVLTHALAYNELSGKEPQQPSFFRRLFSKS